MTNPEIINPETYTNPKEATIGIIIPWAMITERTSLEWPILNWPFLGMSVLE
jgi:hypothetical protein